MCNVLFHVSPDKQKVGVKKNFDPHLQNRGAALGLPPQLRNAHTWYKTFQTSYVAVTNKTVKQ